MLWMTVLRSRSRANGGGGRCWGPHVGSKIDQGGIGLMTDGGYHGKAAPGDGANHLFFIKSPEVLE